MRVRISVSKGMLRNISRLKTRAPGEKFPRVETGLQRSACMEVPIALPTRYSAEALSFGDLRLINEQMT